jgi:ribonuclease E
MAAKRMLIDALHPEETRVAVLDGNRLEDIDVEVASRKQLKGNIYLAKVTRVEPSLQAAFVDYGGNRHGFLAFNEIHPDYYQIPVADREALVAEHNADERADEAKRSAEDGPEGDADSGNGRSSDVEVIGGDDSEEVEVRRPTAMRRHYKIQEVIKRRQILLIQVVKEERGNKGAAVTTYLSLAGRYCVLMPNTARGGGISRKIPAGKERLKSVLSDLKIPEGMGVIVRTAGAERSKAEVRRDFDYLLRLWDNVRHLTLESIAPVLVYEEANLIKRSIRDLYSREIDEVIIEGEEGYKIARDFMKLMIPSHVKRVQLYQEEMMPLFHRYQVENQQDAMHSPVVRLKSGGYIVINPTEALVSIDVNSGRSTRERNIEETALRTNHEACDEIARQLRLRDLAGLVVIDFIDMEVSRNRVQIERRMKDAMRNDRARIQLGRISPFGLLELSRQRLRPSLLETSFEVCPHCAGAGVRRSTESTALHLLRIIEEEGIKRRSREVTFHMSSDVALYLLNHKRHALNTFESRYDVKIVLAADDTLIPPDHRIERIKVRTAEERAEDEAAVGPIGVESGAEAEQAVQAEQAEQAEQTEQTDDGGDEESTRKRRRRRPRRRRRSEDTETTGAETAAVGEAAEADTTSESETAASAESGEDDADKPSKRRRRGKRGGRRRRTGREAENGAEAVAETSAETPDAAETEMPADQPQADAQAAGGETESQPEATEAAAAASSEAAVAEPAKEQKKTTRPRRSTRKPKKDAAAEAAPAEQAPVSEPAEKAAASEEDVPAPAVGPIKTAVPAPVEPELALAEPAGADIAATEAPVPDEAPIATAAEARTVVIDIDSDEAKSSKEKPRRGWWRRS